MPGICGGFRGGNGSDWRWCKGGKPKEEEEEEKKREKWKGEAGKDDATEVKHKSTHTGSGSI